MMNNGWRLGSQPISSVAVIGAGPSGLAAAKRLRECGLNTIIFDRRNEVGGIWCIEESACLNQNTHISAITSPVLCSKSAGRLRSSAESRSTTAQSNPPPSAGYSSLTTNIISPLMTFHGFEWPRDTELFMPWKSVLQYLSRFSEANGLNTIIQHNTNVLRVLKTPESTWKIERETLARDSQWHDSAFECSEEKFDAVVVCNGHYDEASFPEVPGLEQWLLVWPDSITHSRNYVDNVPFKDQTVLVLGSGVSAFDLSKDIALSARLVYQSVRQRVHDDRPASEKLIEQYVWTTTPDNVIRVAETAQFGNVKQNQEMRGAEVVMKDGSFLTGIDSIVLCTGYLYSLPFLENHHTSDLMRISQQPTIISPDGSHLPHLYLDIFHLTDPTLAFVGVPHDVATFRLFDFQAAAIAAVFSGQVNLPSKQSMTISHRKRLERGGAGKALHSYGLQKELAYIREIADFWADSSRVQTIAQDYETVLLEAKRNEIQNFRARLLATTCFPNKSEDEVKHMIETKTRALRMELEQLELVAST